MGSVCFRVSVVLLLVAVVGCERADVPLSAVKGVVLLNGKPVPQAQITMHPQFAGPGWMPVASALGDGSFEVSTRQPGDGAPPGKYKLTITWHPKATDDDPGPNFLPARYAQVATSNLELEVGPTASDSVVLQLQN